MAVGGGDFKRSAVCKACARGGSGRRRDRWSNLRPSVSGRAIPTTKIIRTSWELMKQAYFNDRAERATGSYIGRPALLSKKTVVRSYWSWFLNGFLENMQGHTRPDKIRRSAGRPAIARGFTLQDWCQAAQRAGESRASSRPF